ncbi:MAG TPA: M28 family peptidase [Steroidobacteraceae bacterium]|jgi:Zn-dependent M28 family amino/carboxypeptidase|nr:M28 family peptidase [Steroidobacteraceae bacterium]
MKRFERALAHLVPALLAGFAIPALAAPKPTPIDEGFYRTHIARLAADEFEGRKPGTTAEKRTLDYLEAEFRKLGLQPGNGGSFLQEVPMVEITAGADTSLSFTTAGTASDLKFREDMVIWTKRVKEGETIDQSPIVFVGHGVTAPEYAWDDYAGIDMHGKTALILINDPGFATDDPTLFRGRAMTYYGRWTYKFEEAARRGASGAIIIHQTAPAAYGWETVVNSWSTPQLDHSTADDNATRVAIEGWITEAAAEHLFVANGSTLADAVRRANTRGFRAEPLRSTASAKVHNAIRRATSHNLAAVLRGSRRPDEYLVYVAHWDHLGVLTGCSGDCILNGAVDNATGTSGLLTIAKAFAEARRKPGRSIVFLSVTLEESGLLGSAYYVDNPLFPLARTVAAFNMDAIYFGGPTRDVSVVNLGASELETYLSAAARAQGRVLKGEPNPEKGTFFRSDQFSFAKRGVPALYIKTGIDDREHGAAWGQRQLDEYIARRYHKAGDEYSSAADLRAGVDDLSLLYAIGVKLAGEKTFPNWNPDSEFRAARDLSRAGAR